MYVTSQVITQRKGSEHYCVFIKGAPETVAGMCDPDTGTFLKEIKAFLGV